MALHSAPALLSPLESSSPLPEESTGANADPTMALPITEKPRRPRYPSGPHPAFYIGFWIVSSNLTILFNKWLIDSAGFPICLTTWHMVFAAIATQVLARTTRLLNGRKAVHMTSRKYMRAVVPIGLVYSASLVCSNMPYLYLSVAFIQMLKAAGPVSTLVISWLWGVSSPSQSAVLKVLVIVAGVMIASVGEIRIKWIGVFYQIAGLVFESMRLVMTEVLMSNNGEKMDPLVSLYYYAPVCGAMNLVVAYFTELGSFNMADVQRIGSFVLVLNALVAFFLNVASVFLIGKTSSLALSLSGIFKSILLVVTGVIIWGTPISGVQMFGYLVALFGLLIYNIPSEIINEWLGFSSSRLTI
ncbi:unnamed protein product [Discula destructiva]